LSSSPRGACSAVGFASRSLRHGAAALALSILTFLPVRAARADDEPEFPPFDKQVKDMELKDGYWDVYYKAKDQSLLGVIPSSELERPFLLTSSLSGGTPYAGWQWTDTLAAWERVGKKLVLVEKNVHYRADPERPIADAVVRTYSDRVIRSLQILGEGGKGVLVNLRELFVDRPGELLGDLSIDSSLAKVTKRKSFPSNLELEFSAPLSGDGTIVTFHYSIRQLPDPEASGYKPRLADDRVGYFLTAIKDFTKGDPRDKRFLRFVNRWDLKKASPELPLSPPKKPIVFYIEKTVPYRYRRWVEAGILEWNKAFEKVGIVNAVVVRQQTADNEFKDFDPEDARYNFLRWIVSDQPYAMGPSRVDPRTGQILDADIVFDDSMVEAYAGDYEALLKEGPKVYRPAAAGSALEGAHAFAQNLSSALEPFGVKVDPARAETAFARIAGIDGALVPRAPITSIAELDARLKSHPAFARCRVGEGSAHKLALASAITTLLADDDGSASRAKNLPEDFLGEVIKETVMHEVGHTLGLRHNFKGSSWRTLAEINSSEKPGDVSGSVMDYNPLNIAPAGMPQGHYQNTILGPYDFWAIDYGYATADEGRDLDPQALAAIASRSEESGHAYGTDEDLGSPDPLIAQWDEGQDPIAYAKARTELALKLRDQLLARAVRTGEGWEHLRHAFLMVLYEQAHAGWVAARMLGAQELHRDHKGDPNEKSPVVIAPAARQREALQFACQTVFEDANFKLSPELLTHLAAGRWSHWGSNDDSANTSFAIHDEILSVQRWTLSTLLDEATLERVRDAQLKVAATEEAITIPEILSTIEKSIFRELDNQTNGGSAKISTFRQNLQDCYVRLLTNLALDQEAPGGSGQVLVTRNGRPVGPGTNVTAKKLAWLHLVQLAAKCATYVQGHGSLDEETRAHLEALAKRGEQVKNAEYVHIASGCALVPGRGSPLALVPLLAALAGLVVLRRRRTR
jgi:hypothetical protein